MSHTCQHILESAQLDKPYLPFYGVLMPALSRCETRSTFAWHHARQPREWGRTTQT